MKKNYQRKFIFLLLLVAGFYNLKAQKSANKGFTITGKIDKVDSGLIILSYEIDTLTLDTARVQNGTYKFTGNVSEPALANLHLITASPKMIFYRKDFFIENAAIQVHNDTATGTASTNQYDAFDREMMYINSNASPLYLKAYKEKDSLLAKKYMKQASELSSRIPVMMHEQVKNHPDSWVSLYFLSLFQNHDSPAEVLSSLEQLSPVIRESKKGKTLESVLKGKLAASVDTKAKDFMIPDADGNNISLASYKGKYVLIDFWASWCGPCREENPNVKKAYEIYKNRGLNILGISLDNNKKSWLDAVKKDSLSWTQACDFTGIHTKSAVAYGVSQIPSNFLIDPTGKIIAKNLRGDDLEKELEKVFR